MAFIIKCDLFDISAGQPGLVSVKRYEGAKPEQGDLVFLWFSESARGAGLAGHGLVHAVSDEDPADIAIVIEAAGPARALTKAHLAADRDTSGNGPLSSLARKLFRHSLNKVAILDADEEAFLSEHWEARPAGGSRYDPLRDWLLNQSSRELTVSFQEVEGILGSSLPASAELPQWWANTTKIHTNVQRKAWRAAGYDAFLMKDQAQVRFVKGF